MKYKPAAPAIRVASFVEGVVDANEQKLVDFYVGQQLEEQAAWLKQRIASGHLKLSEKAFKETLAESAEEYTKEAYQRLPQLKNDALNDPDFAPAYVRPHQEMFRAVEDAVSTITLAAPQVSEMYFQSLSHGDAHLVQEAISDLRMVAALLNQERREKYEAEAQRAEDEGKRVPRAVQPFELDEVSYQRYLAHPKMLERLSARGNAGIDEDAVRSMAQRSRSTVLRDPKTVLGWLGVDALEPTAGLGRPPKSARGR
jgi:hypothetical protein